MRLDWVSLSLTGFSWISLSSTRLSWILLGFLGFYQV